MTILLIAYHVLFILADTLIVVGETGGVQCYVCISEAEPQCGAVFTLGPASHTYIGRCATSCYKFVAQRGDNQAISRGCLPELKTIPQCRRARDGDIVGTICACNGDFCNKSPRDTNVRIACALVGSMTASWMIVWYLVIT
ncbi:hypothetical protein DPMN_008196 [Dreissena polymorpha]|uniref:Protein quiver n=1 Tax=Dreissena polymorpha TaxID=45954 RepID=A0A9D4RWP4_DREPO|nr:hypothetical protein DPMN_008196 [Dreissena polymorpha]